MLNTNRNVFYILKILHDAYGGAYKCGLSLHD